MFRCLSCNNCLMVMGSATCPESTELLAEEEWTLGIFLTGAFSPLPTRLGFFSLALTFELDSVLELPLKPFPDLPREVLCTPSVFWWKVGFPFIWNIWNLKGSAANYGPNWPDLVRIRTFCGKLVQKRSEVVTKSPIWWLKTMCESSVYLKM